MSLLDRLKSWNDARRLERVRGDVAMVAEGRALLALAERLGCDIGFNPAIPQHRAGQIRFLNTDIVPDGKGHSRFKSKVRYAIDLNPEMPTAKLAVTLAHELRHLWQYQVFPPARSLGLNAKLQTVFTRVAEGDAFAFQNYFAQRLAEKKSGSPAAPFDWQDAFLAFQCLHGADYDVEKTQPYLNVLKETRQMTGKLDIRREALAAVFNRAATQDLKGLGDMLKAGLAPKDAAYLTFRSEEDMARQLLAFVNKPMRQRLQRIDHQISTGK